MESLREKYKITDDETEFIANKLKEMMDGIYYLKSKENILIILNHTLDRNYASLMEDFTAKYYIHFATADIEAWLGKYREEKENKS